MKLKLTNRVTEATGVMNQLELRRSTFEDTQSLIEKCNTLYGRIKDLESKIKMYNHKAKRADNLKNKDIYSSEMDALGSELDNARLEYLDKVGQIDMKVNTYRDWETDRKSTRLNSSHSAKSRMPSSA